MKSQQIQLRDYQREAIEGLFAWDWKNAGNPLLVLPTGAGKSIVIAQFIRQVIEQWPGQRILMLTHVKELIAQNAQKLVSIWPEAPIGVYSAGLKRKDTWDPIIFAGIQSAHKKAMHLGRFDLIMIDECHLINVNNDGMYRKFIADSRQINPKLKLIGLTATPFRTGTGDITHGAESLWGGIAYQVGMLDLINQGYLCPLVSKRTVTQIDTSGLHIRQGEFVQKEVEALVDTDALTVAAIDEIATYGNDRKSWLIFCAGVDHAQHVAAAMNLRGIKTGCITGNTRSSERDAVIDDYKAGRIRAITNANVLTTGFDAPATDLLAFLRPTHSPGLYVQMMGRGSRLSPGKENCLVLDFAGNVIRHGPVDLVEAWIPSRRERAAAPTKTCPKCQTIHATAVRECGNCGYVFPFDESPKHDASADDSLILSSQGGQLKRTRYEISRASYAIHKKIGKPDSVKVTYWAGMLQIAREWVCPEHPGIAGMKARAWFQRRNPSIRQFPDSTQSFISIMEESGICPSSITVDESGKYPEIISYEWANQSKAESIDDRCAA